jgi:hypothetical protein
MEIIHMVMPAKTYTGKRLYLSAILNPIPGDYTICMVMCMNGVMIGMMGIILQIVQKSILPGHGKGAIRFFEEAVGIQMLLRVVLPIEAAMVSTLDTILMVSVFQWSALLETRKGHNQNLNKL